MNTPQEHPGRTVPPVRVVDLLAWIDNTGNPWPVSGDAHTVDQHQARTGETPALGGPLHGRLVKSTRPTFITPIATPPLWLRPNADMAGARPEFGEYRLTPMALDGREVYLWQEDHYPTQELDARP